MAFTMTFLTFVHYIAPTICLHAIQDFLYLECVPQWSTTTFSSFLPDGNPEANQFNALVKGQQIILKIFNHFFLLDFVKEFIRIFSSPLTSVFYIPL